MCGSSILAFQVEGCRTEHLNSERNVIGDIQSQKFNIRGKSDVAPCDFRTSKI